MFFRFNVSSSSPFKWLIDLIVFYAVSGIFQPCNAVVSILCDLCKLHTHFYCWEIQLIFSDKQSLNIPISSKITFVWQWAECELLYVLVLHTIIEWIYNKNDTCVTYTYINIISNFERIHTYIYPKSSTTKVIKTCPKLLTDWTWCLLYTTKDMHSQWANTPK